MVLYFFLPARTIYLFSLNDITPLFGMVLLHRPLYYSELVTNHWSIGLGDALYVTVLSNCRRCS